MTVPLPPQRRGAPDCGVKPAALSTATRLLLRAAPVAPAAPPTYSYNPAGKSDPFLPFIETDLAVKKEKEKKAKEEELKKKVRSAKRPISPLQQARSGSSASSGSPVTTRERMAIVEDGVAKKYYPLFVGTYIGPNEGRVVSILPDRVIVEEPVRSPAGEGQKMQIRRMTIMLHKEE